jgi:hypothetical protein
MMSSGSYWAFREAAELPDRDYEGPDVRVLWDKTHAARRPHLCSLCDEEIPAGARYRSLGQIVDGDFEVMKMHGRGYGEYPSACPKFRPRDLADIAAEEAQYQADQQRYFPTNSGTNKRPIP